MSESHCKVFTAVAAGTQGELSAFKKCSSLEIGLAHNHHPYTSARKFCVCV